MNYINLINILGIAVIGNMIAHWFLPIQPAKRWLIERTKPSSTIYLALDTALNCTKCMSFWLYLIVYQNVLMAALCSFVGYLINFTIDKIQAWYE